jgi:SagB-type dehydrogenase family enzyme
MYFNFFHTLTKELQDNPQDMKDWPDEWKETQYKKYNGAKSIPLSEPERDLQQTLFQTIEARTTRRDFHPNIYVSHQELSTIIRYSFAQKNTPVPGTKKINQRRYPSAGARYPLEVYFYVHKTSDVKLPIGLYHFSVETESLELLDERDQGEILSELVLEKWIKNGSILVCITGVFERTMGKYGLRGYRFILQEVGQVNAIIGLVCEALGLAMAQIGATNDELIETFLDIDGTTESVLSVSALGKQNNATPK